MKLLDLFRKKATDFTPAVSSFRNFFGGGLFGKTTNYMDKYNGWVFLCVSLISQEVKSANLRLYQKGRNGNDKENTNHPILDLLSKPNGEMTGAELMDFISSNIDLDGNAYVFKAIIGGKTKELWPLRPDWVKIVPSKDKVRLIEKYVYFRNGMRDGVDILPEEMMHFRNFNPKFFNNTAPYKGMGTVEAAIRTIEEDETIKEWNARFFKNGAVPEGVLEYDGNLSEEQKNNIEAKWRQKHEGINNAHKVPFLQGGLKYKQTGLSHKELAFIENRKLDRDDILAMFGVPKGLLLSDDVNLANAKTALWAFTRFKIRSRLKMIESVFNLSLPKEYLGQDLYLEYNNPVPEDRELIVAEYEKGCGKWLTPNDIRKEEGLEEIEGGDTLALMNPTPIPVVPEPEEPKKEVKQKDVALNERDQKGEKAWSELIKSQRPYEDKYKNEIKKYFFGLRERVIKRLGNKSAKWIKDFRHNYKESFDLVKEEEEISIVFDLLTPLQREYFEKEGRRALEKLGLVDDFDFTPTTEELLDKYDLRLAGDITDTTIEDIKRIFINAGPETELAEISRRIGEYFDQAEQYRAERIARSETIRTGNAAMEEAWKQSGVVESKEWYTAIDERACEYCLSMDGKIIKLGKNFFEKGDRFMDLTLDYRDISEPPLHTQCRCVLLPVLTKE